MVKSTPPEKSTMARRLRWAVVALVWWQAAPTAWAYTTSSSSSSSSTSDVGIRGAARAAAAAAAATSLPPLDLSSSSSTSTTFSLPPPVYRPGVDVPPKEWWLQRGQGFVHALQAFCQSLSSSLQENHQYRYNTYYQNHHHQQQQSHNRFAVVNATKRSPSLQWIQAWLGPDTAIALQRFYQQLGHGLRQRSIKLQVKVLDQSRLWRHELQNQTQRTVLFMRHGWKQTQTCLETWWDHHPVGQWFQSTVRRFYQRIDQASIPTWWDRDHPRSFQVQAQATWTRARGYMHQARDVWYTRLAPKLTVWYHDWVRRFQSMNEAWQTAMIVTMASAFHTCEEVVAASRTAWSNNKAIWNRFDTTCKVYLNRVAQFVRARWEERYETMDKARETVRILVHHAHDSWLQQTNNDQSTWRRKWRSFRRRADEQLDQWLDVLAIFVERLNDGKHTNDPDNYYAILGVRKTAKPKEIKSAYRKLALKYHPDKAARGMVDGRDAAVTKEQAEQMFHKITTVYSVLLDEDLRHVYDNYGVRGLEALEQGLHPSQARYW